MYCKTLSEATSVELVGGLGIRVPVFGRVKADLTRIPDGATIHIDGQTGSIRLENRA